MKPIDWHLWSVTLSNCNESLWITTKYKSPTQALLKANTVINKKYKDSDIIGFKYNGTIDA